MYLLEGQREFWKNLLQEEKLFSQYLKSVKFKISGIENKCDNDRPSNFTVVYIKDFSLMEDFTLKDYFINFNAKIKVKEKTLSNFLLQLEDEEMSLRNYNKILIGKYSWQGDDYNEVNDKNIGFVNQSIGFFKKKGMKKDLVDKVEKYMLNCAEGYNPYSGDDR